MALPPLERFAAASADELRALGLRLDEIRRDITDLPDWGRIGAGLYEGLRMPLVRWYARQIESPGAVINRLLMFDDTVSREGVEAVLGVEWTNRLLDWGVIASRGAGVASLFTLRVFDGIYVFCDDIRHGGDAAMGSGGTTRRVVSTCLPGERVGSVLEVGCGAAPATLLAATRAGRAIGTDINPRAVEMARINAAVNGLGNAEFRLGSLYEPVAGERFDWIVSQPPYLPHPAGAAEVSYLYGGSRGDELPKALIAGAAQHLTANGRAIVSCDWPLVEGDDVRKRVRALLPAEMSLLQISAPAVRVDEPTSWFSSREDPTLGEHYGNSVERWMDHLLAHQVQGFQPTLNVIVAGSAMPWSGHVALREPLKSVSAERIERLIVIRELLAAGDTALRAARLRTPEDWVLSREGPVAAPQEAVFKVRRRAAQGATVAAETQIPELAAAMLHAVNHADTASDWLAQASAQTGRAPEELWPDAREFLHKALESELLAPEPAAAAQPRG